MKIWCNESQKCYVLTIDASRLDEFTTICERERCPYAIFGKATDDEQLLLGDAHFENNPIEIPMSLLFGKLPGMVREAKSRNFARPAFDLST